MPRTVILEAIIAWLEMLSWSPTAETEEIEENFTEGNRLPAWHSKPKNRFLQVQATDRTDGFFCSVVLHLALAVKGLHVLDRLATLTVVQLDRMKVELVSLLDNR